MIAELLFGILGITREAPDRLERDFMVSSDYDSTRLINRILHLYYVDGLRQADVARRLNLSTAKVNRLLRQAREQGMVEVIIHTPFRQLFDLESRLQAVFDIQEAMVIPPIAEDLEAMRYTLGRAAANYLLEHLRDGDVLVVGGGTAVHATVQAVESDRGYDIQIVPLSGGVQGQVYTDVNYLVTQLAERLGGRAYQLHAPAFVDTPEQREQLLSIGPVKEIMDITRQAKIALFGVGTVSYASRFVQFTALSAEDMKEIAEIHGGVGEIGAYIFNIEGRPCAPEYASRVVGLTLEEIKRIPFTIGVAATRVKALPLYGALRGGYLKALVTDEAAARGILELFERDFRHADRGERDTTSL